MSHTPRFCHATHFSLPLSQDFLFPLWPQTSDVLQLCLMQKGSKICCKSVTPTNSYISKFTTNKCDSLWHFVHQPWRSMLSFAVLLMVQLQSKVPEDQMTCSGSEWWRKVIHWGHTLPTLHLAPTVCIWQAQTPSVPGCLLWVFRVFVEVNSLSVTDWQGKIQTEVSDGVHNDGHFQCHKALSIFLSTDISFLGCSPAACAKAHSCGWFIVYPNEEPDNPFISLGFLWVLLFNSSRKSFACL